MRPLVALLALLAAVASAAYIDGVVIALKQCLCLAPRWAYIDVWAHVAPQKPLDVALYWFDGSWSGPCTVGTGPTAHNICSIPLTASAVALSLLDGGEEVDRIEIWGVKIANVTACDVQPLLEVVNKTTSYAPPSAVVTVRARWVNPIQVRFAAANYTAFRNISVVDLDPCNDYVIKLWFRTPTPSPWHITLYGNYTPISPIVVTTTVTHTMTQTVPQRATETVAQTATVTKTETLTVTYASERVYTTTVTEVVKEVDIRGVALAFLGVGMLGLALVVFILSGRGGMFKRYVERRIVTPGPTAVPHWVKAALLRETTNPDLDPQFFQEYKETVDMVKALVGAQRGEVYLWAGEAMLGLEAAVANAVKPGTKVLVVDNGVYGDGFADLVKMYGGEAIKMGLDWRQSADPSAVDMALEKNKDVEVVTLVHCDTPSTVYNGLGEVAKVASSHGALLIVDAVSSIGADEIKFDE